MTDFCAKDGYTDAEPSSVSCVCSSSLHGYGVKANTSVCKDASVFFERPAYFLQALENRSDVLVCGNCAKFLGNLPLQLQVLQKKVDRMTLIEKISSHCGEGTDPSIVSCDAHCGELYCSQMCKLDHQKRCHRLLCTGVISEEEAETSPLIKFKSFAVTTNEIFLMAADIYGHVCCSQDFGEDINMIIEPLKTYVRELWWDAAIPPKKSKAAKFKKQLQQMVGDAWDLLVEVFDLDRRGLSSILSKDFLSRLIGTFEQNNVGVIRQSPLAAATLSLSPESDPQILQACLDRVQSIAETLDDGFCTDSDCEDDDDDDDDDEDDERSQQDNLETTEKGDEGSTADSQDAANGVTSGNPLYDELHDLIEEHGIDTIFPPLDGTAFYYKVCRVNHSCEPNVLVIYPADTAYDASKDTARHLSENGTHESLSELLHASTQENVTNAMHESCGFSGARPQDAGEALIANMIALRDIAPGEELVQSYIDRTLDYKARWKAIAEYGFTCSCARCIAERDAGEAAGGR